MEVDKHTFMGVIKDSQFNAKAAKPLKFGEDNGFFALLEGDSSSFSFATASGMADCDCKCVKKVTTTTSTTTQRPTTRFTCADPQNYNNPLCTTTQRPKILFSCSDPQNYDDPRCTTTQRPTTTTPRRTYSSTPAPTYLPPTTFSPVRYLSAQIYIIISCFTFDFLLVPVRWKR